MAGDTDELTRAAAAAREDAAAAATLPGRRFSHGTRPVIRWVKGDGRDDVVTRAAIGQATRLFGDSVDYCLCTNGLDATRVRWILEWATQPVEWWPVSEADNPALAALLGAAGCTPAQYGYWWKWFPERARPDAPEWVLDGDMVITGRPSWFAEWLAGTDPCRLTQDDRWPFDQMYGRYAGMVDARLRLYSGLVSLPPGLRYMPVLASVLAEQPLLAGHDGRRDMCEQGVIAATFQRLAAAPIPLYEFPFGRAFEHGLDHGLQGDRGVGWGYHFGHAFRRDNPHFNALCKSGAVLHLATRPDPVARTAWLGAATQWGLPGWSTPDGMARLMLDYASDFAGRKVLELGTSRGRLTTQMAMMGCRVTTIDLYDRGAAQNLEGLGVEVLCMDAHHFLEQGSEVFDLILVDLHGNAPADWAARGPALLRRLAPGGMLLVSNASLWQIPEWSAETGVRNFIAGLGPDWTCAVHDTPLPGLAVIAHAVAPNRALARADADMHLWVDGVEIWPSARDGGRHFFRVQGPVKVMRLRSRHDIPSRSGINPSDNRRLGVGVQFVRLTGAGFDITLTPDWPGFGRGFHTSEHELRWSDGDGLVIVPLPPALHGSLTIEVVAFQLPDYPAPLPAPPVAAPTGRPAIPPV